MADLVSTNDDIEDWRWVEKDDGTFEYQKYVDGEWVTVRVEDY